MRGEILPTLAACVTTLALGGAAPAGAAAPPPALQPEPQAWAIRPPLADPDEAAEISGVACGPGGAEGKQCLIVNDEMRSARLALLKGHELVPGSSVTLLPERDQDQKKFKEADAEGVDYDSGYFYVVGSHGLPKQNGKEIKPLQPSRWFVFRLPASPAGAAQGTDGTAADVERSASLGPILKQKPELAESVGAQLEKNGLNIEGSAVRDGYLYTGLRAPSSIDGKAYVARVRLDSLFERSNPTAHESDVAEVYGLPLGPGVGIRDLTKVTGGFLILTGASSPEDATTRSDASVYFWRGEGLEVTPLRTLKPLSSPPSPPPPPTPKAKIPIPEALLLLDEEPSAYRVLVFSDGVPGGVPTEYKIPKPTG